MSIYSLTKIADARRESVRLLEKAKAYAHDLQKPAQISFYERHIAHLDKLAAGEPSEAPKSDPIAWNMMRVQLDAETQAERALRIISAPTGTYDASTVEAARVICLRGVK